MAQAHSQGRNHDLKINVERTKFFQTRCSQIIPLQEILTTQMARMLVKKDLVQEIGDSLSVIPRIRMYRQEIKLVAKASRAPQLIEN